MNTSNINPIEYAAAHGIVYLDLKLDYAFKLVFGSAGQEENLRILLDSILPEKHIRSVEFLTQEQTGDLPDEKKVIYDIFCKTEDGSEFVVEMQMNPQDDFADRMVYYSTYPVRNSVLRGGKSYRLPEIYVISILNFTMRGVPANDNAINHYTIRTKDGLQLTNSIHYVTVELPKLPEELSESPTQSEGVLYLLDHLGGMDRIPVKLKDIGLENIIGLATFASMDSMTQQEYIARIMDEIDARSQIRTAEEEGMAKGLQQGREEGREDAKADFVSVMRSQGYTEEQISSILGSLG